MGEWYVLISTEKKISGHITQTVHNDNNVKYKKKKIIEEGKQNKINKHNLCTDF